MQQTRQRRAVRQASSVLRSNRKEVSCAKRFALGAFFMRRDENVETVLAKAFGKPTPKQAEFLQTKTRFVGYGGARGGGKSHAIRAKATYLAFEYPGIQMLIVRRSFPELHENHTKRLLAVYARLPKYLRPKYSDSDKVFTFPWGSRIKLGYCNSEDDVLQYQGQECDVLFLDEATQLTEYQFGWLCACVRGTGAYPKRTYVTCNPGGVGHAWVKRLFIDRDFQRGEDARDYTFIQARVWDNAPLFTDDEGYKRTLAELRKHKDGKSLTEKRELAKHSASYVRQLESLEPSLRRAWLEGDWNVFAGQYFTEFSAHTHICAPFAIPDGWRRSVALDYGLDMLAALWFAVSPAGRVYCYRSIEMSDLTVSQSASAILAAQSETVEEYIAPPDLWNRRQDTGRSAAEIFAASGVPLVKSGNSRIDGWLNVKEYLRCDKYEPRMMFFSTCTPLLRCLPLLRHDPARPGDAATQPHDLTHSPDALRYWCSRRQLSPVLDTPDAANPFGQSARGADAVEDYLLGGFEI